MSEPANVTPAAHPLADFVREALRFAPVRLTVAAGFRAAVAMGLPLLLASVLHAPELSWMGLAGFLVTLVDKGGAYRTRAAAMAWAALGACVVCALAPLAGTHLATSLALAFVGATALSFVRIYGGAATSAGVSALVLLLVSLSRPEPSVALSLERGASAGAGGLWAMMLALSLWPVRLYRPARFAVARALRTAAELARDVAKLPFDDDSAAALRQRRAATRAAVEEARATLAATRRGRRGDTGRGERLLVMLESADQSFAALVALREVLAGLRSQDVDAMTPTLDGLAGELDGLAAVVEAEGTDAPFAVAAMAPADPDAGGDVALADALLRRVHTLVEEAAAAASTLEDERPARTPAARVEVDAEPVWREHWTWRSSAARHAARVGVTVTAAVWLTHHFALQRGYWVTLAAAVILQPQLPATLSRALQRVLGTVVGGVLAALLLTQLHDPHVKLAVVFVLAVVSVSVQPLNYALYSALLTPTFILLAEAGVHQPGLVKARIVNTLLGGALALVGSRVLWPTSERELFPNAAAEVIDAARVMARAALAGGAGFADSRREAGLALIEVEASLQRWLAEAPRAVADVEAPMAFVVYARGLSSALVTLAPALALAPAMELEAFASAVDAELAELRAAIAERRAPNGVAEFAPALAAATVEATQRRRLEHVAQQLTTLHGCVARWLAPGQAGGVPSKP